MRPGRLRAYRAGRRARARGARGPSAVAWLVGLLATTQFGCATREIPPRSPTYEDVRPVLVRACGECHGEARAEGGYRVEPYLSAIACPTSAPDVPAVEPPDERAALLAALATPTHAGLLTATETLLVTAWVEAEAPPRRGAMHAPGIVQPASPDFHGSVLRAERWTRMLDPESEGACATCHAGATLGEDPTPGTAPGATSCTTCHDEPEGPFACSTCHGDGDRAFPPRDPCWHPEEAPSAGAHALHSERGVVCATCHGERDVAALAGGAHGDGVLDVVLDPARAGEGARFDAATRTCATTCHDRGGSRPGPRWEGGALLDCGSCHASPPVDHYAGTCDRCHAEASPDGTALALGPLHINGVVDLGDGTEGCGACHGEGDDPTPDQGSHAAHADPSVRVPIDCAECHLVPDEPLAPSHFDETPEAEVVLGPLASARGRTPVYDAPSCRDVACHGAGLGGGAFLEPRWDEPTGAASACGACHGTPPPAPHTTASTCSSLSCHGGLATPGPGVSELGRTLHVDGRVDLW